MRSDLNTDIMAYYDALAYRPFIDSLKNLNDSANIFIAKQQAVIDQAQRTITAKEETGAFYKSESELKDKQNSKLSRANGFWRIYGGVMTFIAGVAVLIILK